MLNITRWFDSLTGDVPVFRHVGEAEVFDKHDVGTATSSGRHEQHRKDQRTFHEIRNARQSTGPS